MSYLSTGYIQAMDSLTLATVACELGAGRSKVGEAVNHSVGLELLKQRGQLLRKGMNVTTVPPIPTIVLNFKKIPINFSK